MNTKMKMRMLSLLLCFVMLVGLMPMTVQAEEDPNPTITITGLTAPQAEQSVEEWFDGNYPVFSPDYDWGGGYWYEGAIDSYEELSDEDEFLGNFVSGRSYTLYLYIESETPTPPLNATLNVPGATSAVYEYCGGYYADIMIVYTVTAPNPTYEVSFDSNGGSAVTAQTIEEGQKATKPADPTKANYAFAGWYSDSNLTQAFDFNTPITGDITLYAKWDVIITAANATITVPVAGEHPDFNPISGDSSRYTVAFETWYLHESPYPDLDANSVFEHGKYYSLRIRFTPNAGYQFDSNTVFTVNGEATDSFGGIRAREYSAVAYAATYTVTYDSAGGSAVTAQTIEAGQKATKPTDPTKAGYDFKGWTLNGSAYDFNTAVNGDITLVAVWEEDNSFMDDWYWALIMLHSQKFDITATASEGGEIDPAGLTKVQYSGKITYTITPDAGYAIKAVFVDGKDVGAVSEYTFKNVTKKHTIHALFEQINPYTDVKAGDWFYDDVLYVTAIGLMEGTGNGKFSPEITTDRAMLVTVLWRLEGCPVVDSPVAFDDVADGLWYSDAIDWASANGIVNGYGDGKFGPTDQITREQIAAILNRYAAYKGWTDGIALPMLAQYKCSEWAEDNVIWAENNGLLDGLGVDVSDMTAKASRAELAAYLAKFYKEFAEN